MSRSVLITGVSRGIGSSTGKVFAESDWAVVGIDKEPPTKASHMEFISGDLGIAEELERVLDKAGGLCKFDCIVNNAGILLTESISETGIGDWDHILAVNLRAPFQVIRRVPSLIATEGGSIVNVGSVHSLATSSGKGSYAASKAGLVGLTRVAALELARHNIRVNAVLPGAIATPMLPDPMRETIVAKTPLQRLGTPEDVAQAILFLADPDRSAFMTGQTIVIDGGASCRLSTE